MPTIRSCLPLLATATLIRLVPTPEVSAADAIHPQTWNSASPAGDVVAEVNPPPLLWPAAQKSGARYSVRLSRDREFRSPDTISAGDLQWAMFNAHRKLEPGKWFWRYAVSVKGKSESESEVFSFQIFDSARPFVTPNAKEMLASCPRSHPRVLIPAAELEAFRRRVASSPEAKAIVREARKRVGAKLPDENAGKPDEQGKNEFEKRNFAKWASKALGNRMSGAASSLSQAYLITGDRELGREAIRHALHVAAWDPEGVTAHNVSDFSYGACLRAMALPYDSCYDLLTDEEKQLLEASIRVRTSRLFKSWSNNLETKVFSAHIWQHMLHEFADAAFATVGEIEEADAWASYVYEIWLNRVPLLGGADGGWANGNNYFSTNFGTLIGIPTFFERLTGVDFFAHPWYRGSLQYMLYTWPPGSNCDGFGDGADRRNTMPMSRIGFADILSDKFGDRAGAWYVNTSLALEGKTLASDDSALRWYRLLEGGGADASVPEVPEGITIPQAKVFPDIGEVAMHTELGRPTPDSNLMVAFRSSPFGSFNHAHADQNSFNILFGGKALFCGSGYYIGYGDDHFKGWYQNTKGHNSVLIDGQGQPQGTTEAWGRITEFLHGEQVSYACGDASTAYGDTGLTGFRRRLVLLRPSTIVVYDELTADHPAGWSWLLHSPDEMTFGSGEKCLLARTENARGRIDVLGSTPLKWTVHHRFDPPAVNWRNMKRGGESVEYPDQWHAIIDSAEKVQAMRYLAIIQVRPGDSGQAMPAPVRAPDGTVSVNDWIIEAGLDPEKDATLQIRSKSGQPVLTVDGGEATLEGKDP